MTGAIYRVVIDVDDYQELKLAGPILSVTATPDDRPDRLDVWYEHRDDAKPTLYPLWILGTGHTTPWTPQTRFHWTLLETVVTSAGLVWHVFLGPKMQARP